MSVSYSRHDECAFSRAAGTASTRISTLLAQKSIRQRWWFTIVVTRELVRYLEAGLILI
jgi:hypothetical protein